MNETTPSNAVLEAKLDAMSAVILANQSAEKEIHAQILLQCQKTNGRVTSLEKAKNIGWGILVTMNIIFVPIAVAVLYKYLKV